MNTNLDITDKFPLDHHSNFTSLSRDNRACYQFGVFSQILFYDFIYINMCVELLCLIG